MTQPSVACAKRGKRRLMARSCAGGVVLETKVIVTYAATPATSASDAAVGELCEHCEWGENVPQKAALDNVTRC